MLGNECKGFFSEHTQLLGQQLWYMVRNGPNQTALFLLLMLGHIPRYHHHSNLSSTASEISSPMPVQLVALR